MKKHLLALAALATVSGFAAAQSATVYGVIDAGVYTTNNGATTGARQTVATSGTWFPSLFGITGSEDLGGGLKASFNLQGSLGIQNGSNYEANNSANANGLFGREATVSLASSAGTIRLGRQIDNMFLQSFLNGVIPTHANSLALNQTLLSGPAAVNSQVAGIFVNNAVEYATPVVNGLQGKGQYSIGGVAGASDKSSAYSGLVTYSGPVSLSAGYSAARDANGSTTGSAVGTKALLGAKYSIGAIDLAAQYNQFKTGTVKTTGYEVGAGYHVTPAFLVAVNYESIDKDTITAGKIDVVSLKAKYDFSKRTYVYSMISNYNSVASANLNQGYAALAAVGTAKATQGVAVGLVHGF